VTGYAAGRCAILEQKTMPASIREATAEVYWTAFRALPKKDRQAVLARFVREREFREDIVDLVLLEERKDRTGSGAGFLLGAARQGS